LTGHAKGSAECGSDIVALTSCLPRIAYRLYVVHVAKVLREIESNNVVAAFWMSTSPLGNRSRRWGVWKLRSNRRMLD
jgi:hypothetical protein